MQSRDERVLWLALVEAAASGDHLLCRDPLPVVYAHGDGAIRHDPPVGVDGDEIDARVCALVRDELGGMNARVERRRVNGHARAAGYDLTVLVLDGCGQRELLRAFGGREGRRDPEVRDAVRSCRGGALRPESVARDVRLEIVEVGERVALVALRAHEEGIGQCRPVHARAGERAAEEEARRGIRVDRVAVGVGGLRRADAHLEFGLAELGDEEAVARETELLSGLVGQRERIAAGRGVARKHEASGERAELIRLHGRLAHLLPARVRDRHDVGLAARRQRVLRVVVAPHDTFPLHGLAGPVDRPVGVDVSDPAPGSVTHEAELVRIQ